MHQGDVTVTTIAEAAKPESAWHHNAYENYFRNSIGDLHDEGRYRTFLPLGRRAGHFPHAKIKPKGEDQQIIVWCSNDYLVYHIDAPGCCGRGAGQCASSENQRNRENHPACSNTEISEYVAGNQYWCDG